MNNTFKTLTNKNINANSAHNHDPKTGTCTRHDTSHKTQETKCSTHHKSTDSILKYPFLAENNNINKSCFH